jgi:Flp pilus assembly protein TadD
MPKLGTNRKKIKDSSRAEDPAEAKQKHKRKQRAAAAAAAAAGDGTSRQQLAAARLFEAAQQAIAQEQYEAALEALRDACELAPDNVELLDAHGALLAELGMEEEAVRVCGLGAAAAAAAAAAAVAVAAVMVFMASQR